MRSALPDRALPDPERIGRHGQVTTALAMLSDREVRPLVADAPIASVGTPTGAGPAILVALGVAAGGRAGEQPVTGSRPGAADQRGAGGRVRPTVPGLQRVRRGRRAPARSAAGVVPRRPAAAPGSVAVSDLPSTAANAPNRSQFSVPLSLGDFVRYVLAAWPGAGWQDGRGDAEPGEAEAPFSKGTVVGAFRAYDNQCGGPHVTVTIVTAPAP